MATQELLDMLARFVRDADARGELSSQDWKLIDNLTVFVSKQSARSLRHRIRSRC